MNNENESCVAAKEYFLPEEIELMKKMVIIRKKLQELNEYDKTIGNQIKDMMLKKKINKVSIEDTDVLEVRTRTKETVIKKTKDEFVKELINMDRKDLIITEITVNVDTVLNEVALGTLDKDFVDKYVSVSKVNALYVNP